VTSLIEADQAQMDKKVDQWIADEEGADSRGLMDGDENDGEIFSSLIEIKPHVRRNKIVQKKDFNY
jgi:hypothetical protein